MNVLELCKKALLLGNVEYNPNVIKHFTGFVIYSRAEELMMSFAGSHLEKTAKLYEFSKTDNLSNELLNEFQTLAISTIEYLEKQIADKTDPDPLCKQYMMLLYCTRITIYRDDWYSYKEVTKPRNLFVKYMYVLYFIECLIRTWSKLPYIMKYFNDTGSTKDKGMFWTLSSYRIKILFEIIDNEVTTKDVRICDFTATKLHRVCAVLLQGLAQGHYSTEFEKTQLYFSALRSALFDSFLIRTVFYPPGLPESQSMDNFTWFKSYPVDQLSNFSIFKEPYEALIHEDDRAKVLTRQIRLHVEANERRAMKERADVEEIEIFDPDNQSKVVAIITRKRTEASYDMLKLSLERYKASYKKVGDAQKHEIQEEIDRIEEAIKKRDDDIEEQTRRFQMEIAKKLQESMDTNKQNGSSKQSEFVCVPQRQFYKDSMVKLDHLRSIQCLPLAQKLHLDTPFVEKLSTEIFRVIAEMLLILNETDFLVVAQSWLLSLTVGFFEREMYRMLHDAGNDFKVRDICAAIRSMEEASLPDFPTSVTDGLSPGHQYYTGISDYCVYWFLGQMMPNTNLYQTIFCFDIEMQYLSFDRFKFENPVITRLCGSWAIMFPDKWETDTGFLNAYHTDKRLCDILAFWTLEMEKRGWRLHNFVTGEISFIKNLDLAIMYEDVLATINAETAARDARLAEETGQS